MSWCLMARRFIIIQEEAYRWKRREEGHESHMKTRLNYGLT